MTTITIEGAEYNTDAIRAIHEKRIRRGHEGAFTSKIIIALLDHIEAQKTPAEPRKSSAMFLQPADDNSLERAKAQQPPAPQVTREQVYRLLLRHVTMGTAMVNLITDKIMALLGGDNA